MMAFLKSKGLGILIVFVFLSILKSWGITDFRRQVTALMIMGLFAVVAVVEHESKR